MAVASFVKYITYIIYARGRTETRGLEDYPLYPLSRLNLDVGPKRE
jgi:hypothetical protein